MNNLESIFFDGQQKTVDKRYVIELLNRYDCSGVCNECGTVSVWMDNRHDACCGDDCCTGTIL